MSPLRIGIAGLGTVGQGVLRLLAAEADALAVRAGRPLLPVAVAARDRFRRRDCDLTGLVWHDDPVALADAPDLDVVVELIGGAEGPARAVAEAALAARRHLVTANKALIAAHGPRLAEQAETHQVSLGFEAAVAGGIPIVKGLREGLAANEVREVHGVLNGTCNFILTKMRLEGQEFATALAEAQALGYAEADPSFDIDGVDTAQKLAILTSVAFGVRPDTGAIHIEGIRHVAKSDLDFAEQLGLRVTLLGIARRRRDGRIEQRVHPCLVPATAQVAAAQGVTNAVIVEGAFCDKVAFVGRGAGGGPTASSVVADLVDIARGRSVPAFGMPAARLTRLVPAPIEERIGAYYLRLEVLDRPGVMADIAAALRDHVVSLESVLQRSRAPDRPVPLVLTTHDTREADMAAALARIADLPAVVEPPRLIRIESF